MTTFPPHRDITGETFQIVDALHSRNLTQAVQLYQDTASTLPAPTRTDLLAAIFAVGALQNQQVATSQFLKRLVSEDLTDLAELRTIHARMDALQEVVRAHSNEAPSSPEMLERIMAAIMPNTGPEF